MKRELRNDIATACGALCLASFGTNLWLFYRYFSTRPSRPQPEPGFVHALNSYGTYVYISDVESTGVVLLWCAFFIGLGLGVAIVPKTYISGRFTTDIAEPSRRGCFMMAVFVALYLAFITFAGPSIAQFAVSHGIVLSADKLLPARSYEELFATWWA